ncbi:hypothetical protein C8B47_03655 [filamentous cyanobacterium CCP4]|nr:hypothetical protein C8B47_03655 [filamentous cyanobacterium CCP4]
MANKKRQLGNRADDYMQEDKPETFGEREYDDDVFAALDAETVTTDEIPIDSIHADPTQPRAIFPYEIGSDRDGDPAKMPERLQAWAELLYDTDNDIPIVKILKGQAEPSQFKTGQGFVDKFVDLLELAYKIRNVGLLQRIGIRASVGGYTIIYGERRWTAFHILDHFLPGEDFSTIPAKVADVSEWVIAKMQAQENVREEPNAIGKARMFAKLLMAAYADNPDAKFDPPHTINAPDCDRPWYAQVSNGDVWRIPRGMGAEFETALGISTATMRKYRNLLKLTDNYKVNNLIWNLADQHDWAEYFMYEIGYYLDIETIEQVLYRSNQNGIDNEEVFREAIESAKNARKLAEKQAQREASRTPEPVGQGESTETSVDTTPASSTDEPYLNRYVELHSGYVGQVIEQRGTWIRLQHPHTDETIEASTHLIIDTDVTPPKEQIKAEIGFSIGDQVRTRTGHTGQIISIDGNLILVSFGNYSTSHKPDDLTIVYQDDSVETQSTGEGDTGADNADSLSFQEKRANAWVGKPARYQGQPVFVIQAKKGMPGYLVVQSGNERHSVPVDSLKPPAPYADDNDDKQLPISSLASLPTKSELLIAPKERPFIHDIALLCASEGLSFKHITAIHELRKDDVDPEELPLQLERAYVEIEKLANHMKDKGKMLFTDIAQAYSEANHDD